MGVRGDAADIVRAAGAGLLCEPEDAASIAAAVSALMDMPPEARRQMGSRGAEYYARELSLSIGVDRFEAAFRKAVK